jgi:hydrophobic/amphiphilic exporter-1 (mainly G- bacteria), HAE1 family
MFVDFFIKRPIFATVCSLVLILGGVICIPTLPIAQYPTIAPPQVTVTSRYTGASAEVVESSVTIPLEQELNGAEGLKYITSTSSNDGSSIITITYDLGRNLDDAVLDIQNRIKTAEARLPEEVRRNGILVAKSSSGFVMAFGLYSKNGEYDNYFISNYADRYIKEPLKRIKGVGDVRIFGERKYAMRVWLDPNKLATRNLTAGDVVRALQEQNIQVAAGQIGQPPYPEGQSFQMSIKAVSRLKDNTEFDDIILKGGADGALVKIKDVGRTEIGAEDYSTFLRFNGQEAVGVGVLQLPSANALEVHNKAEAELKRISKDFPPGLNYLIAFDPTSIVQESIDEVVRTLVEAIVLVVLVIFLFLQSWRSTIIPAITIPVSLIGTFIFVKIFGFSINTLTLFGLTLATGLVVDDAIVVIENIARYIEEKNMEPHEAASAAMGEVTGAVIATSLVLIAVFIPVSFFPGSTGQLYKQFALTIAFSIAISAFNALTLTPALSALLLKKEPEKGGRFWGRVNKTIKGARDKYQSGLSWALKNAGIVFAIFGVCLIGTAFLYRMVPSGFVPNEDSGYFIVTVQAPEGSSLGHTSDVLRQVEGILKEEKDIRGLFAVGGFSFLGAGPNKATLFPALQPLEKRHDRKKQSVNAIIDRVRGKLMSVPGAFVIPFAPPPIQGLGNFGGFQFEILSQGNNIDIGTLAQSTYAIMGEGNKNPKLKGLFSSFTASDPQLLVDVDRNKAKALNVPLTDIFQSMQIYLGSQYVNDFDFMDRIYRVYVQADQQFRANPSDINSIYVRSTTGQMIPLSNLVHVQQKVAPQNITHYNLFRSTEINGSAAPGNSSGQAIREMEALAKKILPKGMSFTWSGISREELDAGNSALIIFALGIVFVFLVLAAQYESFVDPMIILLTVPLAILGALAAQAMRGLQNDVFCQIGLVMLVGLVSKNAILIVEFANQLRRKGVSTVRAAVVAAETRFRPILMTSLAFILGVIPLVRAEGAGAASKNSLGTAVFGGMILGTFLSLFIVPVFYIAIVNTREKAKEWFKSKKKQSSL